MATRHIRPYPIKLNPDQQGQMTDQELKDTLWEAANALRGSVSAAEYKYPVLGLIFLKYVSDMFEAQADVIRQRLADPTSDLFIDDEEIRKESEDVFIIDKTFYEADNIFWVPEDVRFEALLAKAANADFPQKLDKACLLYTSDAADERLSVDLGGRRIIKKKIF